MEESKNIQRTCILPVYLPRSHLASVHHVGIVHILVQCMRSMDNTFRCRFSVQRDVPAGVTQERVNTVLVLFSFFVPPPPALRLDFHLEKRLAVPFSRQRSNRISFSHEL